MNRLLKKKTTAILSLIVMIVGSTGIKAGIDLNRLVEQTEKIFVAEEEGFSIQSKLMSKMEFSNELANKFAIHFLDSDCAEIQAVNKAVVQLQMAEGAKEKYQASQQLDQADFQLIGLLEDQTMDDEDQKELNRFYANLQNCNDQISHSIYNEKVEELLQELEQFPAKQLVQLFQIELPQRYQ